MLLRLQVWNLCATGTQIMRAADRKPFVGKNRRFFPTGSKSPLANCQRAFPYLDLQHVHEVERNDQASKHDGDRGAELDEDVQGRALYSAANVPNAKNVAPKAQIIRKPSLPIYVAMRDGIVPNKS